jgi:hypothetical protein
LISALSRTLFPLSSQKNFLLKSFKQLSKYVKSPFEKYLLIDANQHSKLSESLRIRSNIFANDPMFFMLSEED